MEDQARVHPRVVAACGDVDDDSAPQRTDMILLTYDTARPYLLELVPVKVRMVVGLRVCCRRTACPYPQGLLFKLARPSAWT